jgi:hypothetical protein
VNQIMAKSFNHGTVADLASFVSRDAVDSRNGSRA